jgi:hypothetical protein
LLPELGVVVLDDEVVVVLDELLGAVLKATDPLGEAEETAASAG